MKRAALAVLLTTAFATPVLAQSEKASTALPAGWQIKLDRDGADPSKVSFAAMADGFHATTGPAAIFYKASDNLTGNYVVTATFTQTKAPMHPEAYGIFIGGKNVDKPDAEYGYLIVRGDGKYAIKHRANATDVHTVQDWTDLGVMQKADANGKATNTVSFEVRSDSVRALVNGTQVKSWARSYWGADGVAGLRVNHQLDVHVANFKITPIK